MTGTRPDSDAAIFGEVGGERYFLPHATHWNLLLSELLRQYYRPSVAQTEYASTFLQMPPQGMLFSQYETMEYLWLGECAA